LSKPDLHPRAREVLERRLEQLRERERKNRSESAHKRMLPFREATQKKYREILPLILKMRAEGCTYPQIADHLKAAGITSMRGTPYHWATICNIVHETQNSPRPASGRKSMRMG